MAGTRELDLAIGAAMRSLRRRGSMSDAEVAERMGYRPNGRQQIHRWERGERSIGAGRLLLYLQAVGATLSELDEALDPERTASPRLEQLDRRLRDLAESIER